MQLHILLTPEIKSKMPSTTKEIANFGRIDVIFSDDTEDLLEGNEIISGENAIVEDTKENIIEWLKEFDGVPIGNGVPMLERFNMCHIKPEL